MLPEPLHPAIVHLPIALAVILPLLAVAGIFAIRSAWLPRRAWSLLVVLAGLLVVGSWAALETGEQEEERVERVVAERLIEEHEEAAELFLVLTLVVFAATAAGLFAGRTGDTARVLALVSMLGLLVAGARVGHLGGQLVYEHGAADAYLDQSTQVMRVHDDDD
jgi:uncharacterized membrane protein